MSSLVRVLTNTGKSVKYFNVDALTGKFFDRLIKLPAIKNLEVSDPDLETKLTPDELRRMREKFPYLAPKVRKAEPLPLAVSADFVVKGSPLIAELNDVQIAADEPVIEIDALGATDTEETEPSRAKRGRKPKQA